MQVTLRALTKENYAACLDLKVEESQQNFVASDVQSIADARVYPELVPLTIYHEDTMVGFLMYNGSAPEGVYWIQRLMIDHHHQRKGYGRAALVQLLNILKEYTDCKTIKISYAAENIGAETLYERLGFRKNGEMVDGEVVSCLLVRS
jgi:diamine N-acetyltransferase